MRPVFLFAAAGLLLGLGSMRGLETLENNAVFVPSREIVATPDVYSVPYRDLELVAQDGVRLHAWELEHDDGGTADRPWLLYLHGNGENVSHYLGFTTRLFEVGMNVLMLEYRGYGLSEGEPSEEGLYLDVRAAHAYLTERGVPAERIVAYGFSLGSGVAVDLAAERPVGALVLEAPFTSMVDAAQARYPFVPGFLMQNRFESLEKIGRVDAPVLVLHSPADATVPFEQGVRLYDAAPDPKRFVEYAGGHGGMHAAQRPMEAFDEITAFVREHVGGLE